MVNVPVSERKLVPVRNLRSRNLSACTSLRAFIQGGKDTTIAALKVTATLSNGQHLLDTILYESLVLTRSSGGLCPFLLIVPISHGYLKVVFDKDDQRRRFGKRSG